MTGFFFFCFSVSTKCGKYVTKGHTSYRQAIALTFAQHFDDKESEYYSNLLRTGLSRRVCNGKMFNKRICVIILTSILSGFECFQKNCFIQTRTLKSKLIKSRKQISERSKVGTTGCLCAGVFARILENKAKHMG